MSRHKITRHLSALTLAVAGTSAFVASAQASTPIGAYTTRGAWKYFSAPKLHPPKLHTDARTSFKKLSNGYFMVANFPNLTKTQPASGPAEKLVGQSGPLMLDHHMRPVWFNPVPQNDVALNLRQQTMDRKPVLSWWQGVVTPTGQIASGEDVVVNQSYRTVATLQGERGWTITLHDIIIRGHDAWVTANRNITTDLTPYGGSGTGTLVDSAVQEYNLTKPAGSRLIYSWDALDHIPLTDTFQPPVGHAWDPYHINSVQPGNGTFLTSMRNTWAAYEVNVSTGAIAWTLGGKHSSFTFGPNAQFQWQHDVELHPNNVVSVFDDHCCQITAPGKFASPTSQGRGLVLSLNMTTHTASLTSQYTHRPSLTPAFLGNTQLLSRGNVALGWGSLPFLSEYSKTGKVLLDAFWPGPDLSYRTYVQRWTGKPFFAPSGAVRTKRGKATVYASWDGDTRTIAWRVLAGHSANHLSVVATKLKNGFETAIPLKSSYRAYKVQALSGRRHVLRTSGAFPRPHGPQTSSPGTY